MSEGTLVCNEGSGGDDVGSLRLLVLSIFRGWRYAQIELFVSSLSKHAEVLRGVFEPRAGTFELGCSGERSRDGLRLGNDNSDISWQSSTTRARGTNRAL